uniref:PDZ domain-containing protein n=2 Tax=Hemiselmis andersenii TaxID=464988 RepID=A0A7S1DQW2_HEMAN|mmetsp:Transcript_24563/g.59525  ORF Transcript_24563/g.59525 Transcript_24563/m.59525 type:complete len:186 (+) Transcript_24563:63-620(+)
MELPSWLTCNQPTKAGGDFLSSAESGDGARKPGQADGILQCCNGARGDSHYFGTVREAYGPHGARTVQYRGKSAGVGITFEQETASGVQGDKSLVVEGVARGGPAEKVGGIRKGMTLVGIDNDGSYVDVRGFGSEEVGPIILGHPGTKVTLHFVDGKRHRSVVITREVLRHSVRDPERKEKTHGI